MDSEFYRSVFIYPIPSICDDHLSCRNMSYILRPDDSPGTYNAAADGHVSFVGGEGKRVALNMRDVGCRARGQF